MPPTDSIPQIIAMVILVLFSAYFSATETAFSTFSKTKMKTLAEKGNKKALETEVSRAYLFMLDNNLRIIR